MKPEDLRITQYALGELRGVAREEFEKELAQSEELQRELQETIAVCERLQASSEIEEGLLDEQRASLREACLANVKVAQRRIVRKKMVLWGSLGALAACLVLAPLTPWLEVSRFAGVKTGAPDFEGVNSTFLVPQDSLPKTGWVCTYAAPQASTYPVVTALALSSADAGPLQPAMPSLAAQTSNANENENTGVANQYLTSPVTNAALVADLKNENDRLLSEGEAFYSAGRFDLAAKRYEQVLNNDRYNIDARRGQEKVNVSREKYAATAYNETRARMQYTASLGWERPVTRFDNSAPRVAVAASPTQSENTQEARREAKVEASMDRRPSEEFYESLDENPFLLVQERPLSTFSIDVDTASYANVRRFLQKDRLPPQEAVRVEELVNYFSYDYPQPTDGQPFSVGIETASTPWNPQHELVRIALKGRDIAVSERGAANLVFLIDVSGSMESENKLPLLKRSLQALVKNLSQEDRVAIVVYAGSSGLVLPSTSGKERQRILEALNNLKAGGGTNGGEGIELAYHTARDSFIKDGNNRVILCSDGDFNVGITNQDDLVALIERERRSGVFLSVLGFGDGNLKDATMEKLADKGNGNYAYIDSFSEGRKVLVEQMDATLFTIAKDVKIQVEFNPAEVAGYRLIGYENRMLAKEDFNNDKKDAGEIGAGHTVTALYEVIRAGQQVPDQPSVDPLKYQTPEPVKAEVRPGSGELLTVKLRYKAPDGDKSLLIERSVAAGVIRPFDQASPDFQLAAAVAAFGMKLRDSSHGGDISWSEIQKIARRNLGEDPGSYRAEFLTLIEKASRLSR